MTKEQITMSNGDSSGTIDHLIEFLNLAKANGATHYNMSWSEDPIWSFKWFETYRVKTEREVREEEIKRLQERINELTAKQEQA